jgi:hypothetical protein
MIPQSRDGGPVVVSRGMRLGSTVATVGLNLAQTSQSAVSPISNRQGLRNSSALPILDALRVANPRYGRFGNLHYVARGEIAALSGVQDDARQFQISVPVQPGNSGGPLTDIAVPVPNTTAAFLS